MRGWIARGVIDGGCVSWRPLRHDPGAQSDGLSLKQPQERSTAGMEAKLAEASVRVPWRFGDEGGGMCEL